MKNLVNINFTIFDGTRVSTPAEGCKIIAFDGVDHIIGYVSTSFHYVETAGLDKEAALKYATPSFNVSNSNTIKAFFINSAWAYISDIDEMYYDELWEITNNESKK